MHVTKLPNFPTSASNNKLSKKSKIQPIIEQNYFEVIKEGVELLSSTRMITKLSLFSVSNSLLMKVR